MDNQEVIQSLLSFMTETLKDSKAFANEQLPLLAKEIVAFEFWSSTMVIGLCLFLMILVNLMVFAMYKESRRVSSFDNDGGPIVAVFVIGNCILCTTIGVQTFDMVKTSTAPRMVVMEEITNMAKKLSK